MACQSNDTNINRGAGDNGNIYSNQSPLIVTLSEKLWIGLGSILVLIVMFLAFGVYCLGRQHGRTDERLIFLEGLAAGETYKFKLTDHHGGKQWQLNMEEQKRLVSKRQKAK